MGSDMGGRSYKHVSSFSPNDSNTICDRTGFKVKLSETELTWEGWRVIRAAWAPRQPQDFPVVPQKQIVYPDARSEQSNPLTTAQPAIPIV